MTITTFSRYSLGHFCVVACTVVLALSGYTFAYRPNGLPCRAHFQCDSGFCNQMLQCEPQKELGAACFGHEDCQSMRCSGGVCQVKQPVNGTCQINEDCLEAWCSSGTCSPWKGRNELCDNDFECRSGRCTRNPKVCEFVIYEPNICGKDSDCFGGRCKTDRGINRCVARKNNLDKCFDNGDCLSLRCEQENCTEPVWLEQPCDEPSDCYSMLCNKERSQCVATADEADTFEDFDPQYEIIGSTQAEAVYSGNGTVDINSGQVLSGNMQGQGGDGQGGSSAFTSLNAFKTGTALFGAISFVLYHLV